jgi:hypothetical protein
VQYGRDGFVVRTGWARAAAPAPPPALPDAWRQELTAFEADLRAQLLAGAESAAAAPSAAVMDPSDADALLRRVQALITRSEQRQRQELAQRTSAVVREMEMQRRADLRGVQQTVGQLEGQTGIAVRQNQELANYVYRIQASLER